MLPLVILKVFQFIYTWKDFLMPLIFVRRDEPRPVSLGMALFFAWYTADRGRGAAGVAIPMLPMAVLHLLLQCRFI